MLDDLSVEGRRTFLIVSLTLGMVVSNVTFGLRLWAKKLSGGGVNKEDAFMGVALLLSYVFVICQSYSKFNVIQATIYLVFATSAYSVDSRTWRSPSQCFKSRFIEFQKGSFCVPKSPTAFDRLRQDLHPPPLRPSLPHADVQKDLVGHLVIYCCMGR